jgi:hypothetical protein
MSRLALMPDDEFESDPTTETPTNLAHMQACDARRFMDEIRAGKGLRFPWTDLDRLVGPLLPGWFVAVGGRAKAGKTSILLHLLTAWTELGKTVVYVGTETEVAMLKYQWAAVRCQVPIAEAIDPDCPPAIFDRLMQDVEVTQARPDLAHRAIFADAPDATMEALAQWVGYGKQHQADALIFDHLSQLEVAAGERWQHLGDAIHGIKKLGRNNRMTICAGAQLTQGQGGSVLGEHEIPGNGSWAGSAEVQRTVDVGIQAWRPFKPGITPKQKQEAREDMSKANELIQHGVMGIRLAAHRWGKPANTFCKLYVRDGAIEGWSPR